MSLVNDMLRDLDQRRRESDGIGARVKLTPASEFRKIGKSRTVYYIVAGLMLAAAGLGYFWVQLNAEDEPRRLNSRPEVAAIGASISTPTPVSITALDESAESEMPTIDSQNEPPLVASRGLNLRELAEAPTDTASASAGPARAEDRAPVAEVAAEPPALEDNSVTTVSLTDAYSGEGFSNSVKDVAEMSQDQQDTMAVQEALRLIAENRMPAAFEVLEKHIRENRYAHQSRETYAKLLMSQGSAADANALVEAGLQLAPNHSGFKKVKARLLMADGNMEDAVILLLGRAPEVSFDLEYHELLASAQLANRDYEGASSSYRSLVQQDRSQGRWWYGFASSQESLGNDDLAQQGYSQAIQQQNLSASLRRRSQDRLSGLSQ